MAGAKPGVHVVQLKPVVVPDSLQHGNKFVKWDDGCTMGIPVSLRVDAKGHILFWKDQNKEMDSLDISLIRDARTGKYAKIPKDLKLRESLMIGSADIPLEDKTLSVGYGTDMVNIDWINFVCSQKETAQEWAKELLDYSTNLLVLNSSSLTYLEKVYSKFTQVLGPDGKMPVKNIVKMVAQNRDDRRRVENALGAAGFASGKNDSLDPKDFTFEHFFNFYRHLVGRTEVDKVFDEIGAKKKPYLTVDQFQTFLNNQQRDPRLNEILYPFYTKAQAQELIEQFENKAGMAEKGHMSQEGFLKFLMSEENNLIPPEKLDLSEDMNQPLAHYFINSSHNTYLTGHQLTGKSSVEIYRQALLSGCRCVELDCWDGRGADEEPMITHGFTMCTDVPFKDVVEAIAESAFKTSEYPVILSFENHCSPKQQTKMAHYCRTIFGDMLLTTTFEEYPLEPEAPLPLLSLMKRKILIKNRKKHFHRGQGRFGSNTKASIKSEKSKVSMSESDERESTPTRKPHIPEESVNQNGITERPASQISDNDTVEKAKIEAKIDKGNRLEKMYSGSGGGTDAIEMFDDSGSDSDSDDDEDVEDPVTGDIMTEEEKSRRQREKREKGTAGSEAEAAMEMSLLVNYVQPVHFHSFEASEKKGRSYEISSFVETQATNLLKEYPVDFVNYNKRQLSRIYPKGTRVDSSNFLPQVFWNAGCQLVALNYQTLDLAMQLNLGIFEYNGRCGYILKPDFMRRKDRHFDPFAESTVDGIVAGTVKVRVISGQFLTDKKVGSYVEVDMYGLPTDTVRKKFRTKVVPANGINPVYDEDPFVFKKVVLPNLATLRIVVYEETGKLIGHRVLPVEGLRPGYRHIPLRNESNQPLLLQTLFVHLSIMDYVPDSMAEFAEALINPIAYQSKMEKHAQQLATLTEDFEVDEELDGHKDSGIDEKGNERQNSVRVQNGPSAASPAPGDGPKPIRMQSSTHLPLNKQDSTQSGLSQSSTGSGPGSANISRMPSNLPGVENGVSNVSVTQTTKLNDPDILTPTPLCILKNHKTFLKMVAKRDKELESIRKKHDKACDNMTELHALQLDKLNAAQLKARSALEKLHAKNSKKAAKGGEKVDEVQTRCKQELETLMQDQSTKYKELTLTQAQVFVALCDDHYQAEKNVYENYNTPIYDCLLSLMDSNHLAHKKRIEELYDREVAELTKRMDAQSRDHMKLLAKKHKDKQELSRIKREAQQKHVTIAVQERQKLQEILRKRLEELEVILAEIRAEVGTEKVEIIKKYHEECEEKRQKVHQKFQSQLGYVPVKSSQSSPINYPGPDSSPSHTKVETASTTEDKTFINGSREKLNSKEELTSM
ncbi:1-phosphatidylinositol 4,5-bisphosphate phosphodiesterase beta-1 isoform X2 [Patella vulgata]|uniref:1-phosphatidylinositol 4,5-bisphosphate phosphodiesterase beta-1 isoform X2 n=1 Tax=Patella vulgata TaxID=6465 RepID=UPI0024A91AA8|nr:1-phosphatidylinositol 4,5-bisphosphate phosphodiesterase beta-1 isoform X2 [Patella vulgata]